MGVDLKLLPFDHDEGHWAFSSTVLQCCRRRELWDDVQSIPSIVVPPRFHTYVSGADDHCPDQHYGNTQTDPYGDDVKYCLVEDLLALSDHEAVQDNHINRAIWAYLRELPPRTKVALYWH